MTGLPTSGARESAAGPEQERPTAHYVLILVVVLLLAESTVFSVVGFFNTLPFMSPPFEVRQLPWVLTSTLLVGAALQPLSGKLSDLFGRRRVLLVCAGTFLIGSLLAALTTSFPLLMAARVLQASAVALPGVNYAFVRDFLPRRMIPVAIGMLSTGIGVSNLTAPLISGYLLARFDYHAVFWFCFVYMALLAPVVYLVVPANERRRREGRVDYAGSALLTVGLGTLLLALTQGAEFGWTSPRLVVPAVLAVAVLVVFVVVELRTGAPMLDLRSLSGPALRHTMLIGWFGGVALTGWIILVPRLLAAPAGAGFGLSASEIALITLPTGVFGILFGPLGGYWARRNSPRTVAVASSVLVTVAAGLMAFTHDRLWQFIVFGALLGAGQGLCYAACPNLMIDAVPARETGVNGGVLAAVTAIAAAVMPVVFSVVLDQHGAGARVDAGRYSAAFLLLTVSGVVALVLALRMRHGRAPSRGGAPGH